ncbi:hypothetical protein KC334_g11123 [Hortaea werneckii]|nr:hypothetical protein KC334_g11123 [Hortaea werneckii]
MPAPPPPPPPPPPPGAAGGPPPPPPPPPPGNLPQRPAAKEVKDRVCSTLLDYALRDSYIVSSTKNQADRGNDNREPC